MSQRCYECPFPECPWNKQTISLSTFVERERPSESSMLWSEPSWRHAGSAFFIISEELLPQQKWKELLTLRSKKNTTLIRRWSSWNCQRTKEISREKWPACTFFQKKNQAIEDNGKLHEERHVLGPREPKGGREKSRKAPINRPKVRK